MCTAVVGGSIHRAATSVSAAIDQSPTNPMTSHRINFRSKLGLIGGLASSLGTVSGIVSGVEITVQNNSALKLVTQKNSVTWTALFQPPAKALHFHLESPIAQSLLECSILVHRPDGQNSLRLKSRVRGRYSTLVIERGIIRCRKCGRPVINVEKHGIESAGM